MHALSFRQGAPGPGLRFQQCCTVGVVMSILDGLGGECQVFFGATWGELKKIEKSPKKLEKVVDMWKHKRIIVITKVTK